MRGWRSSRAKVREAELHAALAGGPPLTWPPAPEPPTPEPAAAPTAAAPVPAVPVPATPVPAAVAVPAPQPPPAPLPPSADALLVQTQLMKLLESVTNMCERVTELVEADRTERALLVDTLRDLGRAITEGAASASVAPPIIIPAPASPETEPELEPAEPRPPAEPRSGVPLGERVLGGSMPAGPDPAPANGGAEVIDLREPARTEIAVEVRGRFGDRWVDGFEICEVMTTPDGPRYRLRRRRDGAVLPELFDATSIRHVETFEELNGDGVSEPASRNWSRS